MTPFLRSFATATATLFLIGLCVMVWVAGNFLPLEEAGVLYGPDVRTEPYRLFTYAFLHVDFNHLAVNMFMLLLLGREVEAWLGPRLYLVAYAVGVLGSALAVLWKDYAAPTVGASGAVYAIMALLIAAQWTRYRDIRAAVILVLANVIYSFAVPNLSLWGHMGGLCAGILFAAGVLVLRRR